MASRDFVDALGRAWTVWAVRPTIPYHTSTGTNLSEGWLAFKCVDGEQRRLAPIPESADGWATAADDDLRQWCTDAQCIRYSRS